MTGQKKKKKKCHFLGTYSVEDKRTDLPFTSKRGTLLLASVSKTPDSCDTFSMISLAALWMVSTEAFRSDDMRDFAIRTMTRLID